MMINEHEFLVDSLMVLGSHDAGGTNPKANLGLRFMTKVPTTVTSARDRFRGQPTTHWTR